MPLIAGMYESLKNIKGKIKSYDHKTEFPSNNINKLKNYFFQKIKDNNHIKITGSINHRLPNHISFLLLNRLFKPRLCQKTSRCRQNIESIQHRS